jgi:hypothetical protein
MRQSTGVSPNGTVPREPLARAGPPHAARLKVGDVHKSEICSNPPSELRQAHHGGPIAAGAEPIGAAARADPLGAPEQRRSAGPPGPYRPLSYLTVASL